MTRRGKALWGSLVGPLGPGSSLLVLGAAAASGAAVGAASRRAGPWRAALLAAVAFDLAGGLVAFQLEPTRDQHARTSRASRLAFAAVHGQPLVVPLTRQGSWRLGFARWLVAVATTACLESRPSLPRRRVVANGLGAVAGLVDLRLSRGEGQRWLGPVYLMKVVGGHGGLPQADSPAW